MVAVHKHPSHKWLGYCQPAQAQTPASLRRLVRLLLGRSCKRVKG